ncbi:MAG TPA: 2-oxo-4-hydroxy-4-carboxy-5-ureidoimidazoline decarboxylase [Herpetosiphonaceae bacterium]|nr:2-oxo-4-hydroxy-4-carboxy-5-ureidoimidazoline decarboxylase [Herpetosiphonaceae bacterium]
MPHPPIDLEWLNGLTREDFARELGFVFEGPPWIVEQAWEDRPFDDPDQLLAALVAVMERAPAEQKVALIRAHPDLVGRAALAGTLTPESTGEQAAAGLGNLAAEDIAAFNDLNARYHDRFGFPFVICARENKKASILAGFAERLTHSRDEEIAAALREVAKIARLRLLDRLAPTAGQG